MSARVYTYSTDTKMIRVSPEAKKAIEDAKQPGVEMWKFTSDVVFIGLAVLKRLRSQKKDVASIFNYDLTEQLEAALNTVVGPKGR
jgi:hypothetical protein